MRLVSRFAALSGIALVIAVALTLVVVRANVRDQAQHRAIADAQRVAEQFRADSSSVTAFQYWGPHAKAAGNRLGFVDDFFTHAGARAVLYSPGGLVTYAADRSLIGTSAPKPAVVRRALSNPQYDVSGGIESAYVPVQSAFKSHTVLGVLRIERDYGPTAAAIRHDFVTQAVTVGAALLLLYLATLPLMRRVTRSLRRAYVDRAQLAAIVDHSNDAIIAYAPDGSITSWNDGAERIYGWRADEVLGRDIALLSPEAPGLLHTTHLRKDGRPVQVSVSVSPIRDDAGTIIGSSVTARDVTQLVELERELQDLHRQEAVARLAGEVAGDLDRILREIESGDVGAVARGESLVRQLLGLGRSRELSPELLDLNEAVEAAVSDDVSLDLEPDLGSVVADAAQVRELITSLVGNARGRVELRTANVDFSRRKRDGGHGSYVMLAVSDSEPTEVGGRMALGLAAACAIVKQHGGTLGTETRPDGGTVIRVYLPRAAAADRVPLPA